VVNLVSGSAETHGAGHRRGRCTLFFASRLPINLRRANQNPSATGQTSLRCRAEARSRNIRGGRFVSAVYRGGDLARVGLASTTRH
jgi:hypothetical protein